MGARPPRNRLTFEVDWHEPSTGLIRRYQLMYTPATQEVEMYDPKHRKTFLRKCKCDSVTKDLLFVGSSVTVCTRKLLLIDYADNYTRNMLEQHHERTLAIIKPDAVHALGPILDDVYQEGFLVCQARMCWLSNTEAQQFYAAHLSKPFFEKLTSFMSSGPLLVMELASPGAISKWRTLIGPTDSQLAREQAPESLRARFGTDGTRNACHGSDSTAASAAEAAFFFGHLESWQRQLVGHYDIPRSCTLGIIKPHCVRAGQAGAVLHDIEQQFKVEALRMYTLNMAEAGDLYEVYRGVVSHADYAGMMEELTSGPCIALAVSVPPPLQASDSRAGTNPVEAFRQLCGAADVDIAKLLQPGTLRAKYGVTKAKNAVHCTDLVDDGELEVSYFFTTLVQARQASGQP